MHRSIAFTRVSFLVEYAALSPITNSTQGSKRPSAANGAKKRDDTGGLPELLVDVNNTHWYGTIPCDLIHSLLFRRYLYTHAI